MLTSKQIKEKKERDLYKDWHTIIKDREDIASIQFYSDKLRPLLDAQIKYMYGE